MILTPVFGGSGSSQTLIAAITESGLTSNLQLCLDAGDASSYTSGTKWLDRSGNGYDFDITGATFNGSPGSLAAYWSFDGGDYFTYDTTNETWMQNLHKNNAAFSCFFGVYLPTTTAFPIAGTNGTAAFANIGINYNALSFSNGQSLTVSNSGAVLNKFSDGACAVGANLAGLSINEATGAGGGFFYGNGAYMQVSASNTFDSTYTTPSASNATYTMQIGAKGNNVAPASSGTRMMFIAFWSTALTKANFDSLYVRLRGRLGI